MKSKLFTLLLAVAASIGTIYAWTFQHVQIGDLYYNLEVTNQTAEVTSQNGSYPLWSTDITTADIPASVNYNYLTYTVTSIGNYAFRGCTGLTSVTIPNSVTSIGTGAFSLCEGLTSITIPNSVTSIGKYAFEWCKGLTSVTIPNSVTYIENYTFDECLNLTSVTIGNNVTEIKYFAFEGCSNITSVVWNAKSCNSYNFGSKVTSFTFGEGVESIPESLCSKMYLLTSISIPNSVTSIGKYAFEWCKGLTSVTIPNSVTYIGEGAFSGCTGLTSPVYNEHVFAYMPTSYSGACAIPDGTEEIAGRAFYGCTGLTSITIPNSVTNIGSSAFRGCTGLTSITIPNSVYWIDDYAFSGCTGFTSVTIPNNSESVWIGNYAFDGCTGLTSVTCYNTQPPYVFSKSFSSNPIIYVPEDIVFAYRTDADWGRYTIMPIEASSVHTNDVKAQPTETTASIAWPTVSGAATYDLVIKDNSGNVICTLVFNAQGQLKSITFAAPSVRNNTPEQIQQAGFEFTVNGLEPGTTYNYTVTSKNASGGTINVKNGTFTTLSPTGIEEVLANPSAAKDGKFLHDGQIYILRGEKIFNLQGAEIK